MSNKTQLQTNNTNLDALITRVNAAKNTAASLPEVGGGGGFETVTIRSAQGIFVNGVCVVPNIDTEVPISLNPQCDCYALGYWCPFYNISITFEVEGSGATYTKVSNDTHHTPDYINYTYSVDLRFSPGDIIVITGESDF